MVRCRYDAGAVLADGKFGKYRTILYLSVCYELHFNSFRLHYVACAACVLCGERCRCNHVHSRHCARNDSHLVGRDTRTDADCAWHWRNQGAHLIGQCKIDDSCCLITAVRGKLRRRPVGCEAVFDSRVLCRILLCHQRWRSGLHMRTQTLLVNPRFESQISTLLTPKLRADVSCFGASQCGHIDLFLNIANRGQRVLSACLWTSRCTDACGDHRVCSWKQAVRQCASDAKCDRGHIPCVEDWHQAQACGVENRRLG